jgi:hypothetical protein
MQSIPSYILACVCFYMYFNDKRAHRLVVGSLALATFSQFAVNSQEPWPQQGFRAQPYCVQAWPGGELAFI